MKYSFLNFVAIAASSQFSAFRLIIVWMGCGAADGVPVAQDLTDVEGLLRCGFFEGSTLFQLFRKHDIPPFAEPLATCWHWLL